MPRADLITPRQGEILELLAQGGSCKHIARQLGISHETVRKHLSMVRTNLGLRRATELVNYWLQYHHPDDGFPTARGHELSLLTQREYQVASLLAKGYAAKEIARILSIAPGTVAKHRENLLRKLNLHRVSELPLRLYRVPDDGTASG